MNRDHPAAPVLVSEGLVRGDVDAKLPRGYGIDRTVALEPLSLGLALQRSPCALVRDGVLLSHEVPPASISRATLPLELRRTRKR